MFEICVIYRKGGGITEIEQEKEKKNKRNRNPKEGRRREGCRLLV